MRVTIEPSAVERRFRFFPRLRGPLLSGSFFVLCGVFAWIRGEYLWMYLSFGFFLLPFGALIVVALARRRAVEVTLEYLFIPRMLRSDVLIRFDQILGVDDRADRLDIEDTQGRSFVIPGDWLRSDQDFIELAALVKERSRRAKDLAVERAKSAK